MKLRPCPKCRSKDIETNDCGYNTYNPGWAMCKKCGHKVKVSCVKGPNDPAIVAAWNLIPDSEKLKNERNKSRSLRKQLREAGIAPTG